MPTGFGPRSTAAAILLVTVFLLGGSSGDIPGRAMLIELAAIGALAIVLLRWEGPRPPLSIIVGAGLVLALPLLQLVPLPPGWWKSLPGRELPGDIAGFIGGGQWRPLSLDPHATLKSWLGLLPPLAMFLLALQLSRRGQRRLIAVLVGIAGISVVLGILQLATGTTQLTLFADAVANLPSGLFGNRNHQASFLVVAAIFAFALATDSAPGDRLQRVVCLSLLVLFVAGIFATGSRAGIALLGMAAITAPFLLVRHAARWKLAVGTALLLAVGALLLMRSDVVLAALDRFDAMGANGRYRFWPEVVFAIATYLPVGAGIGTFVQSFQGIESLDSVDTRFINHAHNDYLEMLLESGLAGLALIVFLAVLLAWWVWRVFAHGDRDRTLPARAATLGMLVLLLHSLVDYPLRTPAMLTTFAMLFGIIVAATARRPRATATAARRPFRIAIVALCLAAAANVVLVGASDIAVARGRPEIALGLWPTGAAGAAYAERLLGAGKPAAALDIATQAVARAPQSAAALRMVARAAAATGRADAAETAWILAARLGWRDGFVQQWLLDQAIARHDHVAAAQAADALLRIDFQRPATVQRLLTLLHTPGGRAAVAERMAARPPWGTRFFDRFAQDPASDGTDAILFMAELERRDALPGDADAYAIFKRLIAKGQGPALVAIWRRINPGLTGDPLRGVVDGDFVGFASGAPRRGPFGWRSGLDPSVTVTAQPRTELAAEKAITIDSATDRRRPALSQLLALPPGDYALRFDSRLVRGAAGDFAWEILCDPQRKRLLRQALSGSDGLWVARGARFTVPGAGCTSQTLRLIAGPTGEEGSVANVRRVSAAPAAGTTPRR